MYVPYDCKYQWSLYFAVQIKIVFKNLTYENLTVHNCSMQSKYIIIQLLDLTLAVLKSTTKVPTLSANFSGYTVKTTIMYICSIILCSYLLLLLLLSVQMFQGHIMMQLAKQKIYLNIEICFVVLRNCFVYLKVSSIQHHYGLGVSFSLHYLYHYISCSRFPLLLVPVAAGKHIVQALPLLCMPSSAELVNVIIMIMIIGFRAGTKHHFLIELN